MTKYLSDRTYEEVNRILVYLPSTGEIRWKDRPQARKAWRKRCAGKLATGQARGRLIVNLRNKLYAAHRLAWLLFYKEWPSMDIDHIDGDYHNNRITNLRLATRSQNQCNRRLQSNNTSGYKGVGWCNQNRKWYARVKLKGKLHYYGYHQTPELAYQAVQKGLKQLHGEFARIK